MADSTVENLAELAATPTTADLFHVIDDPAGTPTSKKITIDNLMNFSAADVIVFTNKSYDLGGTGNVLTGSAAEFNTALQTETFSMIGVAETRAAVMTYSSTPIFQDGVKIALGTNTDSTIVDTGSAMIIDFDEANATGKSLDIQSDATSILLINDTIATLSVPLDVPDIETITISASDGTLAQTIADSTGVTTFVSGAVLVAPVLGTPASGVLSGCTAYVGDSSLVTVGTIATGTWEGDAVTSANLDADTAHLTTNQVFTGVKTFGGVADVGKLAVAGTTSGTTIVDAVAVASGVLTLPAATDTLVGKDTVDIFTNKSYDLGGTGNVLTGSTAEFNTALQSETFSYIGVANAWGAVDQDIGATGKWQEAGANISPIGIHDIYIPAPSMWESTTGGCAALAKLELATDQDIQTLDFDGASIEAAQFAVALPKNWNAGTITATFYWSSTATDTGDVDWRLSGVSVGDGIVVTTAYGSAITVTDANQSVANDMLISAATGAITINGAGKSEFCRFLVERDGGSDTASEDARLHGIMLHITTDASTAV